MTDHGGSTTVRNPQGCAACGEHDAQDGASCCSDCAHASFDTHGDVRNPLCSVCGLFYGARFLVGGRGWLCKACVAGQSYPWCEEVCDERRCPMACGLPAGHQGEHACLPPDADVEHLYGVVTD